MEKLKPSAYLLALLGTLISAVLQVSAKEGYTPANLDLVHHIFQHNEPFDFEYNLYGNYFESVNMSQDFMKLQQRGRSMGFVFQQQWQQIARGIDRTSRGLECLQQLEALVAGIGENDLTSYKYFDSWGKIPAGLLKGHLTELGNYDQCVELNALLAKDSHLVGKYCFARLPLGKSNALGPIGISIGVCMPAVCSAQEFDNFYKLFLKNLLNITIGPETSLVSERSCKLGEMPPFSPMKWFAIVVLCILAAAMAFSSLYEYFTKLSGKTPVPLLCAFSVQSNLSQLLKVVPNTKSPNVIPCLNGIRCLSMVWVVAGHGASLEIQKPHINTLDIIKWGRSAYSMFYQQAPSSVDTFFFLSGLLISFLALREMDRNKGKLNVPMMYVHRILRLAPMVALAILIYAELYTQWARGPTSRIIPFCDENWWVTLLFVQNFVRPQRMCLFHSWYLSIDMQLYILSPIFLFMLYRWRKKGVAAIATLGVLLVACLFTTMMINDYRYHSNGYYEATPNAKLKTYYPTHLRASPWLIGLLLGYYLHNNRHKRIVLSKFVVVLGWLFAFAMFAVVIFAWYPQAQLNARHTTTLEEALYNSLSRVAWPLGLSWLVFACVKGYGGPIDSFLSCPLWQPMARLSYSMYLWHLFVGGVNAGILKTNTYFSSWNMTLNFWGDFGWTILISTAMHLAFEAPLLNIEKLLLPSRSKKTTTNTVSQRQLIEAEQDSAEKLPTEANTSEPIHSFQSPEKEQQVA